MGSCHETVKGASVALIATTFITCVFENNDITRGRPESRTENLATVGSVTSRWISSTLAGAKPRSLRLFCRKNQRREVTTFLLVLPITEWLFFRQAAGTPCVFFAFFQLNFDGSGSSTLRFIHFILLDWSLFEPADYRNLATISQDGVFSDNSAHF